ncbi:hypothetical protein C8F04DRAFT_915626, partial [Mycena alexandri]
EVQNAKRDILISIKTPDVNNIVSRAKNHEFRKYLISRTVERMWYAKLCNGLIHALIDNLRHPSDIENEEGLANADFSAGRKSAAIAGGSYAYEIMHLYKLARSLHISVLGERYKISPPQRYAY